MFDPTIFDNLKVTLEGALYDLDREEALSVIGREDLVDLASMGRTFRMRFRRLEGTCVGEVTLRSELDDFAGELRPLRIADAASAPGAHLRLMFELPESKLDSVSAAHAAIAEDWNEAAEIAIELVSVIVPEASDGGVRRTDEPVGEYGIAHGRLSERQHARIILSFRGKIDEADIGEIPVMLEQAAISLEQLDAI